MGRIFCEGSVDRNELWGYLDQIGEYRQYCSRSGMKKLPQIGRTRSRYSAVTNPSAAVMVGNELYVGHGPSHRVQLSGTFLTSTIEEFRLYRPTQDRNEYLRFPGSIFFAAPPTTDDGDVCIAHLVYGGQAIDNGDAWQPLDVDASQFAGLQLLRYHNGQRYGTPKQVRVDVEAESWRKTCLALLDEKANKLCVKGEWAMLLVPELGVLVALDKEPEGGAVIDLPMKNWDCSGLVLSSVQCSSNIAISGNMAYVIFVHDIRSSEFNEEGDFVTTRHPTASLISCDLVKGEYVDRIDAEEVFAASKMTDDQEYELHLKVVQGHVYLHGISTHVLRTEGDILSPCSFAYRVETSDEKLSLTRQVSDLDSFEDTTHKPAFRWIGGRVHVDLSPCEHASMLHLQAGREEDPMLCERLRQYTW